jgi:hydrogenase maturation protein HypF
VGFRPHVYNLARSFGLEGYVLNDSQGVKIEAEEEEAVLEAFRIHLLQNPPRLADVQEARWQITEATGEFQGFGIQESAGDGAKTVLVSPDVAACPDCTREMGDPSDPRHGYPFINCTNCGPRYTIIREVPYDRKNTTMSLFPLCPLCREQYEDPADRRFHAQPVACPACGPALSLIDCKGRPLMTAGSREVIAESARLLRQGKIVAVKGIGGYHLAADAENEDAVSTLRKRKFREDRPFALMAADMETARRYCRVSREEEALLLSFKAPIVLLERGDGRGPAPSVSPGNRFLGVMLAYTPLHRLLLQEFGGPLVMTSGNVSDEPIAYDDGEALERLRGIADAFLTHNRPIHIRCDDSVTRVFQGREYVLRRSRGYVPFPVILHRASPVPILSVGAHQKNTFCLLRENKAFISHHVGDLENEATLESFTNGIRHFQNLFDARPGVVAYDPHPRYLSTRYALELPVDVKIPVQHHHAHVASVMADNGLDGEVAGIALDGSGYGSDGNLWGCEFMAAGYGSFHRLVHLRYTPMPGGEAAVKEPWRMALAYARGAYGNSAREMEYAFRKTISKEKIDFILAMMDKNVSCPLISSAGRLFDAVSSLAGLRHQCRFEGQAAIDLEMMTDRTAEGEYPFVIDESSMPCVIDPSGVIAGVMEDVGRGVAPSVIGGRFHNTMAAIVARGAGIVRKKTGLNRAALSGGVFQNMILLEKAVQALRRDGFEVFIHRRVPANDGGISLGQAAAAVFGSVVSG